MGLNIDNGGREKRKKLFFTLRPYEVGVFGGYNADN
jgi:hypothetical protein